MSDNLPERSSWVLANEVNRVYFSFKVKLDVIAMLVILICWKLGQEEREFEASLGHIISSRLGWTTYGNPVSKTATNKQTKNLSGWLNPMKEVFFSGVGWVWMSSTGTYLEWFPGWGAVWGGCGDFGGSYEVGEIEHWKLVLENVLSLVTSWFIFCFLVGHEVNNSSLLRVYFHCDLQSCVEAKQWWTLPSKEQDQITLSSLQSPCHPYHLTFLSLW